MTCSSRVLLSVAALCVCFSGCWGKPNAVHAYKKDGVQFSYYSNWSIAKDAPVIEKPDIRLVHIEGPHHAVVSLICVPPSSAQTLEQFADAVATRRGTAIEKKLSVGSLKTAAVEKGTSESVVLRVGGNDQTGIRQRFTIDLLGQQIPHETMFFMLRGTKHKILIMSQVAVKHLDAARPAIQLILDSLRVDDGP